MAELFDPDKRPVLDLVQVNIPFTWLMDRNAGYMEIFLENRINPEIGIDADALERFSVSDFARTARRFRQAGCRITLHGPFLDLSPGSPDPRILSVTKQRLAQTVEAAAKFSPETVVCHAGYDQSRYGFIRDEWYERAAETWKEFSRELAAENICLMLENVYETDPAQLVRLFELISDKNTGCCLDIGHFNVFSTLPSESWTESLWPYTGQVHLHDNNGTSDQHLGIGLGKIDFNPLFPRLRQKSSPPVITLEPHRKEDLIESVSALARMLPLSPDLT